VRPGLGPDGLRKRTAPTPDDGHIATIVLATLQRGDKAAPQDQPHVADALGEPDSLFNYPPAIRKVIYTTNALLYLAINLTPRARELPHEHTPEAVQDR